VAEAIPHFEDAIRLSHHDPRRWAYLVHGSLAFMLLERYEAAEFSTERFAEQSLFYHQDTAEQDL
jgi:hypothetical protein